jgi:hypothetical protein
MRDALVIVLAAAGLLAGCANSLVPVKELTGPQAAQLSGYTEVTLPAAAFSTMSLANAQTGPNGSQTDAQRGGAAISAAYAGASLPVAPTTPPGPATSGTPPPDSLFNFQAQGDSAQAWATTTPSGMPFLLVQSFGAGDSAGTASWRARVQMPANATNLYVQFMLPAVEITGFTEQNGPSNWQSRVRAELQMNGHPVWSTEATRISLLNQQPTDPTNCSPGLFEKANYLAPFGATLGLTSDHHVSSPAKTVTLNLGGFPSGQTVEVALIVRSDAQVLTHCCKKKVDNETKLFCTRATSSVAWDNTAKPVRFWVGPNIP